MKNFKTGFVTKCLLFIGLAILPSLSMGQIKLSQSMSPGGTFGLVDVNELKGGLMMVDNLADRDQIFMNRAKRGMMVVVIDANGTLAGDQTKTFMFLPSEEPADYADAGKIWNTYDEYSVHTVAEFISKYSLDPWVEVSLGLKDPDGPGIDSIFISTSFIDTIFSNNGDTIYLVDKVKTDSLYANYLNLSGVQILGVSTDETFANASNDSIVTQLAIKNYVQNELSSLTSNANITNLTVDTLTADSAYIADAKIDTLETILGSIDSLAINQLTIDGKIVTGISDAINLGGASASDDSISTQLAVKTYVDNNFIDLSKAASIDNLTADTLTSDTAFISNLLNNIFVSDSINVDTLIAVYTTIDTASINKVSVNYFTLNGYWVGSISNDTVFTSASSTALITEFAVQNRIDSVMTYVNNEFSSLSQNSIENPLNSTTRIVVNENDSLVFTVNGDTAMVISPDGTVIADTLAVQQLALSGDTIKGISTNIALGGVNASDDTISTQLAVKTYVDTEISKLSGATTTDTLRANVAYVNQANLDTIVSDTAYITDLLADTLTVAVLKPDSIIMDGDTLVAVAASGDVVPDTALDKTLVTAGYVKNTASAFPEGLNPVTRAGWTGVSGQDLDADNVVEFLKKVFFPVPEPRIVDFNVNGSATYHSYETAPGGDANGAVTETISPLLEIPYATWKNSGFSLTFNYDVDNRSAIDANITTTAIATVNLLSSPGLVNSTDSPNSTASNITGSFTVNKADFGTPSATTNNDYTFTLSVADEYPNLNTLTLPVRLRDATRLTVNYFRINGGNGPITVEGDGTDKTPVLSWSINSQEDTIADITIVQELPTAANIATGSTTAIDSYSNTITAPAQGTHTYRYDLRVTSDVFGTAVTTNINRTYIITDRHFWGYIYLADKQYIESISNGTNVPLNTFFPDAPSRGNQLNKNWVGSQPNADNASGASASDGITFITTTPGDVYACIAIPKTTAAIELHQWDSYSSQWKVSPGISYKVVKYTVGTLEKDYWLVFNQSAFSSTAAPIFRVVEK